MRSIPVRVLAALLLFACPPAALALPGSDAARPVVFHSSGDSVEVRFGDYRGISRLTGVPSPDTTWLDPDHDLILLSRADSVFIPRSTAPVEVELVLSAGTLTEVFFFERSSARDLRRYRALLRQYSRFGRIAPTRQALFEVRTADPEADSMRAAFPIDSIAGKGGDLSRMRNLLRWVHGRARWDGSKDNPTASSLARTMEACIRDGATMNCGGLAATYAAACRAARLPARQIVCLPFDPADPDCHSVVVVYSDSLRRWIYMDPTFEASWTDRAGRLLGLEDARALLAAGDTVLVDAGANVNGERRDPTDHLAYMSKNLFRFKTWLDERTAIFLSPAGFDSVRTVAAQKWIDRNRRVLVTDDPAVFWAPPRSAR